MDGVRVGDFLQKFLMKFKNFFGVNQQLPAFGCQHCTAPGSVKQFNAELVLQAGNTCRYGRLGGVQLFTGGPKTTQLGYPIEGFKGSDIHNFPEPNPFSGTTAESCHWHFSGAVSGPQAHTPQPCPAAAGTGLQWPYRRRLPWWPRSGRATACLG